ncbi:MAG: hypothetical protein ABMA25_10945 [Ilumatobacteraceae bacterium]
MFGGIDVPTVVVSTTLSVIVSLLVSVALKSTGLGIRNRIRRLAARRRLMRDGDHATIAAGTVTGLSGGRSSRVEVRVAPAVSFRSSCRLEVDPIDAWLQQVAPQLVGCREHCDPGALIRYRDEGHHATVLVNGQIAVCLPVEDSGLDTDDGPRLDLTSVVSVVVPVVLELVARYEELFPKRLLTPRLDWRFDINSDLDVPERGRTQRAGLVFPARQPGGNTPGQGTPNSGQAGFGGDSVRNVSLGTPAVEIVMAFLTDLVERSGYTSVDGALADLRSEIVNVEAAWRCSTT